VASSTNPAQPVENSSAAGGRSCASEERVKDVNSIPHAKKITTREGINIGHLRGMSTRNATSGHRMARSRRPERPGMTRPVLNA
jgi:hypothetical protein